MLLASKRVHEGLIRVNAVTNELVTPMFARRSTGEVLRGVSDDWPDPKIAAEGVAWEPFASYKHALQALSDAFRSDLGFEPLD